MKHIESLSEITSRQAELSLEQLGLKESALVSGAVVLGFALETLGRKIMSSDNTATHPETHVTDPWHPDNFEDTLTIICSESPLNPRS